MSHYMRHVPVIGKTFENLRLKLLILAKDFVKVFLNTYRPKHLI